MNFLFRRWQLKFLALLMAVALYLFTGTQITVERTFTIQVLPEQLRGLPANYRLSTPLVPNEFSVTIAGPQRQIEDVVAQDLAPMLTVTTDGLTAGFQEFNITERLLRLNPAFTLRSRSVDRIRAEFARVIEDVLTLEGRPAISGLAEGLRAEVSLVRSQVLVQGPANVIASLRERGRVPVRPIDLSDVSATISEMQELRVPLVIQVGDAPVRTVEQPEAVVRVSPAPETRVIGPVPVHALAPPDILARYEIEITPPVVALTVSGPVNRLREQDPVQILRAYVDVGDARRGAIGEERTVRVLAPSWLTTTTTTVRVSVRPRLGSAAPPVDAEPFSAEPPAPLPPEPTPPSPE
ncbi:MAG: hypothetical protein EA402_05685 [Planctomycetota bacterium]|nr:MAG: hypothetical protein EA402_05685 [Planctomycetota bacterium]